ncbi:MAG: VPLPA-CTERM-specific exosortase XrtD, partial [Burkholderiales bacterium]
NLAWVCFVAALVMLVVAFTGVFSSLVNFWSTQEEYSFGYLIPLISAFLVWQKKDLLEQLEFDGAWPGFAMVALSLGLFVFGDISTLGTVSQYGLLLAIAGLVMAYTGVSGFRVILVPVCVLIFMVPLPNYFLREISQALQLLSSGIGVAVIRLFDISVHLEGNVIDLGSMKLQVVEACSGLRYLFPLMTLGFIAAYFFKEKFWKRAVLFLSTIPVTVLMNSLRIGLIGIAVEYGGKSMAEGFLHDFEGWAVFMACTGVLIVEMWLLSRWSVPRRPLREVFGLELPASSPAGVPRNTRRLPTPFLSAVVLVVAVATIFLLLPKPVHHAPARKEFSAFPLEMGAWTGRADRIDPIYLEQLMLSDYLLVDYVQEGTRPVNFYVSWYNSQADGNSAHSPKACIPGDGWEISDFTRAQLHSVQFAGRPLEVNRVVIQKGEYRQLVYYWFQQRGRVVTGEYAVKLHIFWDAMTRRRSDGAMVRLVTQVGAGEQLVQAEQRLESFAARAVPELAAYVPD